MHIEISDIVEVIQNVTSFPVQQLSDTIMVFQIADERFSVTVTLELFTFTTAYSDDICYGLKLYGTPDSPDGKPFTMDAAHEEHVPTLCAELNSELIWCCVSPQYSEAGDMFLELRRSIHLDEETVSEEPDSQLVTAIDDVICESYLLLPLVQAIADGAVAIDEDLSWLFNTDHNAH